MTYPAPQPFETQALPATPPPKKGWPGSAKVAVIVLAVTTIGAAAAGVVLASSANSDTDDAKAELADVQDELKTVESELEAATERADQAEQKASEAEQAQEQAEADLNEAKADLDASQTARQAAEDQAAALRSLFPLDFVRIAASPLAGTYNLSVTGVSECTGYADNAAACSPDVLPTQIQITGDASSGYSVSSVFFDATSMTEELGRFTATGNVLDGVADLCNGAVSPTAFELAVSVGEVGLSAEDTLQPTVLFVDFKMGAEAVGDCTATSRSVTYNGTPA